MDFFRKSLSNLSGKNVEESNEADQPKQENAQLNSMKNSLNGISNFFSKSLNEVANKSKEVASTAKSKMEIAITESAAKIKEAAIQEKQVISAFLSDEESNKAKREEIERKKQLQILVPPWENLSTQDENIIQDVTNEMQNLSKNWRNFLLAPPDDSTFQFDFNLEENMLLAQVCLKADKKLSDMRFALVPRKIREPAFWRNYFYRIWAIKESYGLNVPNPTPSPSPLHSNEENSLASSPKHSPRHEIKEKVEEPLGMSVVSIVTKTAVRNSPSASRKEKKEESLEGDQKEVLITSHLNEDEEKSFDGKREVDEGDEVVKEEEREEEFVSDSFSYEEEFQHIGGTPEPIEFDISELTQKKSTNPINWAETDWNQILEDGSKMDSTDLEIDEAWEAEMQRELESMDK
eukprot:TRINITY_DN4741_c0_g1_i1.p1 TRINITY_DN4741_c0_g1~~TRINITY_DN4741_c0_g1_i1.p1  ORF type:complete len:406 (-),score=177.28 TRINITY_DN4741_c0_g1_i1:166-1383(-)